jgi:hypothetical protein
MCACDSLCLRRASIHGCSFASLAVGPLAMGASHRRFSFSARSGERAAPPRQWRGAGALIYRPFGSRRNKCDWGFHRIRFAAIENARGVAMAGDALKGTRG